MIHVIFYFDTKRKGKKMSNSSMVSYTRLSPNYTRGRGGEKITRITPHYMAGPLSVETCAGIFANPSRQASSNYGIGLDGRVGLYVDEANRSWCSSSGYNDRKAVTIECANLADGSLTEATWRSLVSLCADICQRNGIARLDYTGNNSGNLTMHKWYGNTDCPGPWLSHEFDRLAREVNAILDGSSTSPSTGAAQNNSNGGKLIVDGIGGFNTILDLQSALGVPYRDGLISGQYRFNQVYFNGITAVDYTKTGSETVKALQRLTGTEVDGHWGHDTSAALQRRLMELKYDIGPCGVDGYFGADSVMALQRCLNENRLK